MPDHIRTYVTVDQGHSCTYVWELFLQTSFLCSHKSHVASLWNIKTQ